MANTDKPKKSTQERQQPQLPMDGVLSRDPTGHELTTSMVSLGCARVSDLLRLDEQRLKAFDGDLAGLRDWMLAQATGVYRGQFVGKLREIMKRYSIAYVDGSDDRRWNSDMTDDELPVEVRLRALLSDRRFWIFQANDGSHELTLAVDTMIRLCQWRKLI